MKHITIALAILMAVSCGKKQQSEDIEIEREVEKPVQQVKNATRKSETKDVTWIDGKSYTYSISYAPLDSAGVIENYGVLYHDNVIHLTIKRADGTEFFSRVITKSSFTGLLSDEMKNHGILTSLIFEKSDNNALYFVASVGSPDDNNEDFFLTQYKVDRFGATTVATYTPPID